ncbi:MAG: DUF3568 family protein [Alphaproteobacteria bacterium]
MGRLRVVSAITALLLLAGCAAVAVTAGGIAGSTGVNHTLNGIVYKTFTTPMKDMRVATLKTLNRMDMPVTDDKEAKFGWLIVATARERVIEIELEKLTNRTTRMRVVANKGDFLKDSATGTEIIIQTVQTLEKSSAGAR